MARWLSSRVPVEIAHEGLAVLLQTNLFVYFEMLKPLPDAPRIGRQVRLRGCLTGRHAGWHHCGDGICDSNSAGMTGR